MTSSSLALWTPEQTQLIATTIAPGCSSDELRLFAYACQRTGLDPFSKQIYAIKRGGKMTIQAGIDGLRAIAERTGELDGSHTEWCGDDGQWSDVWISAKPPAAAKTTIWRKGSSHPFTGVARFADYNAGQGLWSKMPAAMIAKCSEALALRKAFPANLSGVYSTDEMEQQAIEPVTVAAVPAPAGDAKLFAAGKAAIAKAKTIDDLAKVTARMEARKGELSDEQNEQLMQLALSREAELTVPADLGAFDDD
ncbi:MAG: phage recombination protein Bet [Sphingomonadaceae bacterium]|nr:phage recombination protein Bet [Sphingomonadaceae bacterium]